MPYASLRQTDNLLSRTWDLELVLLVEEFLQENNLSWQDFLAWEDENEKMY